MKWNESGFRPPLCTYRLNWAKRTSWGWWDDWGDTVLQTQDSKFEPWRSEAEHATSRSRRLPTILTFTRGWGRNYTDKINQVKELEVNRTIIDQGLLNEGSSVPTLGPAFLYQKRPRRYCVSKRHICPHPLPFAVIGGASPLLGQAPLDDSSRSPIPPWKGWLITVPPPPPWKGWLITVPHFSLE